MCYRAKDIMEGPRLAGLRMTADQFLAVEEDDGWKYELIDGVTVPLIYGDDAPTYSGLRMTTDQYLKLKDDGHRYEVINGVVVMSPSPQLPHQRILSYITFCVEGYLRRKQIGECILDTDVRFSADVLYRPDLALIRAGRLPSRSVRVEIVPDLIVEIASRTTARRDRTTKLADYERFGVAEYLIIDPRTAAITAHKLVKGRYTVTTVKQGHWKSGIFKGLSISIREIKAALSRAEAVDGNGSVERSMASHSPSLAAEIEALKKAYASLNANDLAPMVNLFDPHIEWVEPSDFPQGGTYHGHQAVRAHLTKARERWAEGTCECERLIPIGDKVVAFDDVHVRLKDEVEWRIGKVAAVYTFRQGRIVHVRIFGQRQQALEWVGIPDHGR